MGKTRNVFTFPVVLIGIALLGIYLLWASYFFVYTLPWIAELIRSTGHALIVATVIAAAVDPFIKARLARELSRNFLGYTIGWDIPKPFREKAEELLKGTSVIRNDFSIHYRLITKADNPDILTVETLLEFEAVNLTSKPQVHRVSHDFEETDGAEMLMMRCTSNDPAAEYDRHHLTPSRTHSRGRKRVLEYVVQPVLLQPKERGYQYKFKYSFRFTKEIEDSDSIHFGDTPTSNVSIELDECPTDVEFIPDPGAVPSAGIPSRWTYGNAFFQGDHITVRWGKTVPTQLIPSEPKHDS